LPRLAVYVYEHQKKVLTGTKYIIYGASD